MNLSKEEAFNTDLTAIQEIKFTGNLDQMGNTTMFFFIGKTNGTISDFSKRVVRALYVCYAFEKL